MTTPMKCDLCGDAKNTKNSYGKQLCSQCGIITGKGRTRPDILRSVLAEVEGDQALPSKDLSRISQERDDLRAYLAEVLEQAGMDGTVDTKVNILPELLHGLDMANDTNLTMLRTHNHRLLQLWTLLALRETEPCTTPETIEATYSMIENTVEKLTGDYDRLQAQSVERDKQVDVLKSSLTEVSRALGLSGDVDSSLVALQVQALVDELNEHKDAPPPVSVLCSTQPHGDRDRLLLDLAVGILKNEVHGVEPDFIELMREA